MRVLLSLCSPLLRHLLGLPSALLRRALTLRRLYGWPKMPKIPLPHSGRDGERTTGTLRFHETSCAARRGNRDRNFLSRGRPFPHKTNLASGEHLSLIHI